MSACRTPRSHSASATALAVAAIAPSFGGINLEDISAPRCFEIEARLRDRLDIPLMHDDQHGTAIVVLAALRNAARVVGREGAEGADLPAGFEFTCEAITFRAPWPAYTDPRALRAEILQRMIDRALGD